MVQMMAVLEWMSQIYIPKTLNPNESPAAGEMVQSMAVLELIDESLVANSADAVLDWD